MTTSATPRPALPGTQACLRWRLHTLVRGFDRIPLAFIAFVARFSIAAVFWNSGQTKVEGFAVNLVSGEFRLGWPRLSDTAVSLFRDEYALPFISPAAAALLAAGAEHLFPLLLLIGLATRFSALALLVMTIVIQLLVYPGAYATHGTWAAVLLYLMARGPGKFSVDHWIASYQREPQRDQSF